MFGEGLNKVQFAELDLQLRLIKCKNVCCVHLCPQHRKNIGVYYTCSFRNAVWYCGSLKAIETE